MDVRGHYTTGTVLISPPSADYAIVREEGCIVLAINKAPVSFS